MENTNKFRDIIRRGEVSLGTTTTFVDSTVTEALCSLLDFVWIDMEHNALSLETVQAHLMAAKGSNNTSLGSRALERPGADQAGVGYWRGRGHRAAGAHRR